MAFPLKDDSGQIRERLKEILETLPKAKVRKVYDFVEYLRKKRKKTEKPGFGVYEIGVTGKLNREELYRGR